MGPLGVTFTFSDGMDLGWGSALSALSTIAKTLWNLAQQEKFNKEEIKRLSAHTTNLHDVLYQRCNDLQGIPQNLSGLLQPLNTYVTSTFCDLTTATLNISP